ncbi:unnamed protein product [Acanthoscelides obtectus]|uniref:Uncharacterized protein n=1 Tax=Acanthoscelides obtectus TaxID=200917 RepID=A0A9P0L9U8_ACAOB|nr:unnamed protein product [Acanthoscelides obtectus]CAK1682018.1 Histone-lysine N-methyltransferase SETMAR [Acanthoscelides obtectus]
MVAIFQRTVTADWYTTICLPKVITELRKINPERRTILHQDNASSHTAQKTRQYLTEENVELLNHPPYSPDLSPNDSFTFPKIKNRLRGQRFQSPKGAVDAFKNAVLDLPANEWNKCFENWFERMQMCINQTKNNKFNASKTQYCTLINKKRPSDHPVLMVGRVLPKSPSFRLIGLLGYLFRAKKFFYQHHLLTLYKAQTSPSFECCSQVWSAAAPTTLYGINRELLDYLERHGLISDRQYAFRHQRSTGDLSYGEAHVFALDITNAFDQLWHADFLCKLPSYGPPENICRWVADFLSDRKITEDLIWHEHISSIAAAAGKKLAQIRPSLELSSMMSPRDTSHPNRVELRESFPSSTNLRQFKYRMNKISLGSL